MNFEPLYDISEVCKMLGTTSRTLRFYEEKGIIESTTVGLSSRRRYTEEQLLLIRNVLTLRTLGLSIKTIAALQSKERELKDAVLSRRAEIYASIESRMRDINLLNEALSALESGTNLFGKDWQPASEASAKDCEVAQICTEAIVNGNHTILYAHFSDRLAQYIPPDIYFRVRQDTLAPLGDFVLVEKIVADDRLSNKLYAFAKYAKLGLKITFFFYNGRIDGLWLGYYDVKQCNVER